MSTSCLILAVRILNEKFISPLRRAADIITDYDPDQPRGQPGNAGQFAKAGSTSKASSVIKSKPEPKPIKLGKKEYARVMSAINTLFYTKFAGENEGYIANGNYVYRFTIYDFDDYVFLQKTKIK